MPLGSCEFCTRNVWNEFKPTVLVLELHEIYGFSICEATDPNLGPTLQVGRTRDRFQAVTLGIYSVAADISMCPGGDSASKNEYQDIPGGKGGRWVRVTTLPSSCAECLEIWSLNRPEPSRLHRPVIGVALPFAGPNFHDHIQESNNNTRPQQSTYKRINTHTHAYIHKCQGMSVKYAFTN